MYELTHDSTSKKVWLSYAMDEKLHDMMYESCVFTRYGQSVQTWEVIDLARDTWLTHYNDLIMNAMASQITSPTIVYSTAYSGANQRKHQSSASLIFVGGIHQGPVNPSHKGPVTRKMFPFNDVIIILFVWQRNFLFQLRSSSLMNGTARLVGCLFECFLHDMIKKCQE